VERHHGDDAELLLLPAMISSPGLIIIA